MLDVCSSGAVAIVWRSCELHVCMSSVLSCAVAIVSGLVRCLCACVHVECADLCSRVPNVVDLLN